MNDKLKRAIVSIIIGMVIYFIGEYLASTDVEMGLAYVAGTIAGGCYWIGSRE